MVCVLEAGVYRVQARVLVVVLAVLPLLMALSVQAIEVVRSQRRESSSEASRKWTFATYTLEACHSYQRGSMGGTATGPRLHRDTCK